MLAINPWTLIGWAVFLPVAGVILFILCSAMFMVYMEFKEFKERK